MVNKIKKEIVNEILPDNVKNSYKRIITDKLNEYFTNIDPKLTNRIPSLKGDVTDYIKSSYPNNMFVTSSDSQEIENIVQVLKTSKQYCLLWVVISCYKENFIGQFSTS